MWTCAPLAMFGSRHRRLKTWGELNLHLNILNVLIFTESLWHEAGALHHYMGPRCWSCCICVHHCIWNSHYTSQRRSLSCCSHVEPTSIHSSQVNHLRHLVIDTANSWVCAVHAVHIDHWIYLYFTQNKSLVVILFSLIFTVECNSIVLKSVTVAMFLSGQLISGCVLCSASISRNSPYLVLLLDSLGQTQLGYFNVTSPMWT